MLPLLQSLSLSESAMKEAKIQTIGSIAKQEFHYLIGRKDRGIEKVSDLKGKRIGLPLQTSAEFYLGRYLQLHGINLDDVTLIDLKPTQVEESLIKGDLDAVLIWDPYAYSIEKNLGRNAVVWPAQSGQMMYWLLIARREYVTEHPELIDRLLSSFNQAEQFAVNNPDKAKQIVQTRLKADEAYIQRILAEHQAGAVTRSGAHHRDGGRIALDDRQQPHQQPEDAILSRLYLLAGSQEGKTLIGNCHPLRTRT